MHAKRPREDRCCWSTCELKCALACICVQTSERPSLLSLMQASNTDKVFRHGFHRYYEPLLEPFRDKKGMRMLEIGVESGRSMAAWVKYFSNPASDGIHSQKSSIR